VSAFKGKVNNKNLLLELCNPGIICRTLLGAKNVLRFLNTLRVKSVERFEV
jgi:hypothetical protein